MTTTDDVWSGFNPPGSGDFPEPHKFEQIGSSIAGEIINIRRAEFDGKAIPELWLTTADGDRSVLCGQANLMTQLLEIRPIIGDRIAIQYVKPEKTSGGYTAKIFDVEVKRADGSTVDPAPAPATSAADLL